MERRSIEVRGIVQGVGFRPFVHALASRLRLGGFVANTAGGVRIEIEGDPSLLARFERELAESPPPLARIESVSAERVDVRGERDFRIEASRPGGARHVFISPDAATCDACLDELFDPADRRHRYPFINCTACGPRLTIVTGAPYDRERTTMARFAMCADCEREYHTPSDRRFHAEAIACPACGPRLMAVDASDHEMPGEPIDCAARAIDAGRIVAVKGLGGFHLACDARDAAAVHALRRRKHRDDKPFAIMVRDLAAARMWCEVNEGEAQILTSTARPIVLLRRRRAQPSAIADAVAPGTDRLGIMLPYTPLHHLLLDAIGDAAVVMTSGNRSDEPIVTGNDEALSALAEIADLFLVHDRPISVRCDDSVVEQAGRSTIIVRRSRGYAPAPIALPLACPEPVLAVGGQLKNTFAIARGSQAFLSHHIGDLDDLRALDAYERDLRVFEEMLSVAPAVVAYDGHPDYASTRFALARPARVRIAVQHHHAHVASCLAEHGIDGPVIGIAWDGAGWGADGCVWGGEFLIGDCRRFERAAHFRYVPLPGGDRAAREPWRMALSHLRDAGIDDPRLKPPSVAASTQSAVRQIADRRVHSPLTSSVGRLFDAVASICGVRHLSTYEGHAAMHLEALAARSAVKKAYAFDIDDSLDPAVVDTRRLIQAIAQDRIDGAPAADVARRFHVTLAAIAVEVCVRLRARAALSRVVLTGGVFLNAPLSMETEDRLVREGFEVYRHRKISPGDGGLSLGQLAVAAAEIRQEA